jgi:subtilisin family serine protease
MSSNLFEKKVLRIVVLDTGFTKSPTSKVKLCKNGSKDFTGTDLSDNNGHGSHIANIIADRISPKLDYCLIIVKWYNADQDSTISIEERTLKSFEYIASLKDITAVNYSAGGAGEFIAERDAIMSITISDTKVFVAAGNNAFNLDKDCKFFPACYRINNLNVVGSVDKKGKRHKLSNYGKVVTQWENGVDVLADAGSKGIIYLTGTSQATAIATSKYINSLLEKK